MAVARDRTPASLYVGRIGLTVMTLDAAVAAVLDTTAERIGDRPGRAVHFANAYTVALAEHDDAYAAALADADLVFTDGVPLRWVGARAYPEAAADWERVYGPDVMRGAFERSQGGSPRHYLLGGSPATLAALRARLRDVYPKAEIAGAESPPYRTATGTELAARDARIRDSGADLVWVGLGTPQQDFEVRRLAGALPVTALGVGAAFDFLAGTKPQAPRWMQRNGVEWAFRLATEPRRLGRRYVWGNVVFLGAAARTLRQQRRRRGLSGAGP